MTPEKIGTLVEMLLALDLAEQHLDIAREKWVAAKNTPELAGAVELLEPAVKERGIG